MEHYLIKQRNRIYYYLWEMEKDEMAMDDLAMILNVPIGTLYRTIKKEQKKYK